LTISEIAKVCHQTNKAYCESVGDNSQPNWENAPDWQKESAINGVKAVQKTLNQGEIPNPASSHEGWLKEKEATGWKYGEIKDPEKKEHPCMVPYEKLPPFQKMKDHLFIAVATRLLHSEVI
jgi:hypothetical protein